MSDKKELWIVYTPVVELGYCWLQKPDTKFGDPVYKAEFLLTPEQAKQFAKVIESDPRATFKGKARQLKGTKVDGKVKFRAKQAAQIKWIDKKTGEAQVKDVKPKLLRLVDGATVDYEGGYPKEGSTGEFEFEVVPYDQMGGGISLRLRGVRLHDVIEGSADDGNDKWGEPAFDAVAITVEGEDEDSAEPEEGDDERGW